MLQELLRSNGAASWKRWPCEDVGCVTKSPWWWDA